MCRAEHTGSLDTQIVWCHQDVVDRFLHDDISVTPDCFFMTAPMPPHCENAALLQNTESGACQGDALRAYAFSFSHEVKVPNVRRLPQIADSSVTYQGVAPPANITTPAVTVDAVAALLDGATPLHCAALRGNPSQVEGVWAGGGGGGPGLICPP